MQHRGTLGEPRTGFGSYCSYTWNSKDGHEAVWTTVQRSDGRDGRRISEVQEGRSPSQRSERGKERLYSTDPR